MSTFKNTFISSITVLTFTFFFQEGLSIRVCGIMVFNILLIAWLDEEDKRGIYKFMLGIISYSGITRKKWVWFVRFLALANAVVLFQLGMLTYLIEHDILKTIFACFAATYFFWYLNFLIDSNPPIDNRIIKCFAKNN